MPSVPPSVAPTGQEPCAPVEVCGPCAGIGAELRCLFGAVDTAPLPRSLADLFAAVEARACKPAPGSRFKS